MSEISYVNSATVISRKKEMVFIPGQEPNRISVTPLSSARKTEDVSSIETEPDEDDIYADIYYSNDREEREMRWRRKLYQQSN
jgi:hypothetical protein